MTGISPTRVIGGRYVVLGELARCDTGVVWRAEDRVTGRQVAVKELHLPAGQSREERHSFRERLLRAARAMGRVDDPGVVAVHDVVTDDDVDHIVTELVEAPTLADVVAEGGPLDERAAAALARQLAAALQAIHSAGVVHGATAPGSVLVGPGSRVRLTDLAVSVAGGDPVAAGRPEFVAPELREGGPATPESDVWALGATLTYARYGAPPGAPGAREDAGDPLAAVLPGMLRSAPQARLTARQVTALLESEAQPSARGRARGGRWRWLLGALVLGVLAGVAGGFALARAAEPAVGTLVYGPGGAVQLAATIDDACLRGDLGTGPLGDEARVGCAEPHDLEVFETLDPFGGREMPAPGPDVLARYAGGACTAAFDALVAAPDRDGLEIVALVPSDTAFGTGAREVFCILRAADGSPLVGSSISGERN